MRLYDDTTEPNLTNALVARRGWPQAGPELGTNDYDELLEKVKLAWTDLDDDTRAAIFQDIGTLSRKAVLVNDPRRPEYYDRAKAVVWEVQTPTEGQARYAMVSAIRAPQLDPRHQGQTGSLELHLDIMREGLWRGIRPGNAGHEVINTTVQNYTYQTDKNYVTIPPSAIPGDAPALARIQVNTTAPAESVAGEQLWLMRRKAKTLAELDAFNPYFWMADAASPPTTTVATAAPLNGSGPSAVPGDRLAEHTPGGMISYWWEISNNLEAYAGVFNVWVIYRTQYANGGSVQVDHGWGTGNPLNSYGKLLLPLASGMDSWNYLYLGTIQMPPGGMISGVAPAYFGTYNISLRMSTGDPTTGITQIPGFFLQPVDDQVYSADNKFWQIADGDLRRSWQTNAAGTTLTSANVKAEGDYIELEPGHYNRIYINTVPGLFYMGVTYTVKVSIIPRYQYLRGAETW